MQHKHMVYLCMSSLGLNNPSCTRYIKVHYPSIIILINISVTLSSLIHQSVTEFHCWELQFSVGNK